MVKQVIDIGTNPNQGDGDPLRIAFTKINNNFDELYIANGDISNARSNVLPELDAEYNLGSADKQWADLHVADFIYLNGARIEVTTGGALLVNGGAPAEVQDTVGSVFGDDSTLLVDGINNSINLDGTVKGNIVPDTDEAYDLGSATKRFRDLYLSGNTIDLGGALISASPSGSLVLPANTSIPGVKELGPVAIVDDRQGLQYYNGSAVAAGSTIIDQATYIWAQNGGIELDFNPSTYSATIDGSGNITAIAITTARTYGAAGDVFAGVNTDNMIALDPGIDITDPSAINASSQVEILTALVMSDVISVPVNYNNIDGAFSGNYNDLTNTPDLSNYVQQGDRLDGDLTGSVFADDSTIMIDGAAGKIVGSIDTAQTAIFKDSIVLQNGNDIVTLGDGYGASFQLPNKSFSILGGGVGGGSYNIAFTSNGSGSILATNQFNILGGASIHIGTATGLTINNTVTVDAAVTAPSFVGDVTGSVFADDSTLLVDAVNGNIPGYVSLATLKAEVAASTNFADFQARIAAL